MPYTRASCRSGERRRRKANPGPERSAVHPHSPHWAAPGRGAVVTKKLPCAQPIFASAWCPVLESDSPTCSTSKLNGRCPERRAGVSTIDVKIVRNCRCQKQESSKEVEVDPVLRRRMNRGRAKRRTRPRPRSARSQSHAARHCVPPLVQAARQIACS